VRAIVHRAYGYDGLELRSDVEKPAIEDGQVLVRVHASSVNPVEWYGALGPVFVRVAGGGLRRPKDPTIGADLAGTVEAVAENVTDFSPGDEVFGTSGGSWAEYAVAQANRLARKPASVSFEEAAAVPVAGLTALQAVRDHGNVQRDQKVLINGASGGVGTFAVQLAKHFGAEVTAVCSTSKVELTRELGADRVVDYTQEDFTRRPERYDVMLDIAGSRPFRQFSRVLTPDATVVVIGAPMTAKGLGPLKHIAATRLAAIGRSQTVKFFVAKIRHDDLALLAELMAGGKLKPVIDRRYPLSEAVDALRYLGERHARGKIVVTV
jgi:NADPH:quinone reductase-like Zn-dependent oxidoreductase